MRENNQHLSFIKVDDSLYSLRKTEKTMNNRESGVLLHPTSLPNKYGCGTLGKSAYEFIDWLVDSGQKQWQILPLGPTMSDGSPYQGVSAFAGNELLIDLEILVADQYLVPFDLESVPSFPDNLVDFDVVRYHRAPLLQKAFLEFQGQGGFSRNDFNHFWNEHAWWLESYSMFAACSIRIPANSWKEWPQDLRDRKESALKEYYHMHESDILYHRFVQFMFYKQWFELKKYANNHGVKIFGDVPLYVSYNSADVWANQEIFLLDENLEPTLVGGVPPDYFSEDGQHWGNPLYDWDKLSERNYDWWCARLHFNLHTFDIIRIDHFRGLDEFWAIPASAKSAKEGFWMKADGWDLLQLMKNQRGELPIIAEDLGTITESVNQLRKQFKLPGMKVLHFAFEEGANSVHLPHNFTPDFYVYTGTHDNDTTKGWWNTLNSDNKRIIKDYIGYARESETWQMINYAHASVAQTSIVTVQDLLELDSKSRMNTPGTISGNWSWRLTSKQFQSLPTEKLRRLTIRYGRCEDN